MKRFYSIIVLVDSESDYKAYCVCETQNDEKEIIRMAGLRGLEVSNVVPAEDSGQGIFLNDFPS